MAWALTRSISIAQHQVEVQPQSHQRMMETQTNLSGTVVAALSVVVTSVVGDTRVQTPIGSSLSTGEAVQQWWW